MGLHLARAPDKRYFPSGKAPNIVTDVIDTDKIRPYAIKLSEISRQLSCQVCDISLGNRDQYRFPCCLGDQLQIR